MTSRDFQSTKLIWIEKAAYFLMDCLQGIANWTLSILNALFLKEFNIIDLNNRWHGVLIPVKYRLFSNTPMEVLDIFILSNN